MIKLENVTKVYKNDVVALRDANADIQKGEFVFLVGPSGSGKSTFIRLLNHEEQPDRGRGKGRARLGDVVLSRTLVASARCFRCSRPCPMSVLSVFRH